MSDKDTAKSLEDSPYRVAPHPAHILCAGTLTLDLREVVAAWTYDKANGDGEGIAVIFRSGHKLTFNSVSSTKDIPRAYKDYVLGRR